MDDKRVKDELSRLEELLDRANVPKHQRELLQSVIDNMAWQRVKLDDSRKEMADASIVCEYDNGGGQSGIRENPIFKAYINLWRAYVIGLEKYSSYLPKEFQEEAAGNSESVLHEVIQMKRRSQ